MKASGSSTKRILVIEDESAISDLCRRVLTTEGFEVDIAVQGKIAQDMLEEKQYDLCLIDLRLPAMDGKELYQWLKERHPKLADGVIFSTGDVMGKDATTFIEQSGRPFLPKPFTPDELKDIVREAGKEVE